MRLADFWAFFYSTMGGATTYLIFSVAFTWFQKSYLWNSFICRKYFFKWKFSFSYTILNFKGRKRIYISREPICIIMKLNCISTKSICIDRKLNCISRKTISKKIKKDSCAGNRVSDLWNQNSFVWIQIIFVRNPAGNGI